jgi:predicted nucleic acid-binding protein
MRTLAARVPDGASVLVDTSPLVYVLEGHELGARFAPIFRDVDSGRIQAVITPITLAEILSGPFRAGKEELAERYRHALTTSAGWTLREIDAEVAVLAARLRVRHRLELPDAMQLAVALREGCHALVTHDRDFGSVEDIVLLGVA